MNELSKLKVKELRRNLHYYIIVYVVAITHFITTIMLSINGCIIRSRARSYVRFCTLFWSIIFVCTPTIQKLDPQFFFLNYFITILCSGLSGTICQNSGKTVHETMLRVKGPTHDQFYCVVIHVWRHVWPINWDNCTIPTIFYVGF